jgi:hypothetical protein
MRVALINLAILVALVLLANLGAAAWLDATGRVPRDGTKDPRIDLPAYTDKDAARRFFRDFYDTRAAYSALEGFRVRPLTTETVNVDRNGLRVTPGAIAASSRIVRFFGGSTMWGTGSADRDTIPAHVARALADANVINYGQSGFVSRQNLAALVKLVSTNAPLGTVVFYDGVNDVMNFCDSRVPLDGDAFSLTIDEAVVALQRQRLGEPERLWKATAGHLVEAFARTFHAQSSQTNDIAEVPPSRCAGDPAAIEVIADMLWRNWLMAKLLVEANEGRFIALLQPVSSVGSPRRDYLPQTQEWDLWYRRAYERLRGHIAAGGRGWAFDLSDAFDGDEMLYIDWAHVTERGNRIVAERIVPILLRGSNVSSARVPKQ